MARVKKDEGIEALKPKQDPISIQEITMMDWYAAFALLGGSTMSTPEESAKAAFDQAEECLKERAKRI
jgi:hypothetical protein